MFLMTIYSEFRILIISYQYFDYLMNREIIAAALLGLMSSVSAYISILLSNRKFRRFFTRAQSLKKVAQILGCRTASYIIYTNRKYQFKYLTLLIGISIAIAISVINNTATLFIDSVELEMERAVNSTSTNNIIQNNITGTINNSYFYLNNT